MLKNSLKQAEYDALADILKTEYVKTGADYTLQHDEPVGELKRAKEREATKATELQASLSVVTAELATTKATLAAVPNIETVKATTKAETEAAFEPTKKTLETREKQLTDMLVQGTAKELAFAIGGTKNAEALMPHITPRLAAKLDGEAPKVVILKDGKEDAAMTLATLDADIRGNKALSSLVIVNQSSGGAGRQATTRNAPAGGAGDQTKSFATMSPNDLVASLPAPQAK